MPDGGTITTLAVTLFYGEGARRKTERVYTLPGLKADILAATAKTKAELPWLKLARFGDVKTDKHSLRHDANVLSISGIEADYDGGAVLFADAVDKLEKAGILALVYTSPSHTEDAPRWRVLCPTSTELPPEKRGHLVGRLNGLFGGIFAGESFTLSQSFYFGSVNRNPSHAAEIIDGQPIDLCDELDKTWMGRPASSSAKDKDGKPKTGKADVAQLLAEIVSGEAYHQACVRLAGVWARGGVPYMDARKRLLDAFDAVPEAERDERWKGRRADVDRCLEDIYGKEAKRKDSRERGPRRNAQSSDAGADEFLELTEDGVAIEFTRKHGDALRYCHDSGSWYRWTGTHWQVNRDKLAFSWARTLVRRLNRSAEFKTKAITGKAAFAAAVERFAQADRVFAVTADTWDKEPFLLGTPGGVVDLRTGKQRPARREDFITRTTRVAPADTATCPTWFAFLNQATAGDAHLIRFLCQWCGYALTGSTREHALLFIYGPGGNGKSVFLNTLARILGDYVQSAAMDTFTASHGDRHPTDLAMLRGARLVTATETEEGRAWAESRIKQMTGGDPVSARFMRQDFFTFVPQFKLTIAGNHKPALRNVDEAARRRFNIVPFLHKPPKPDRQLEEKLMAEAPGILRWMIEGCLDWQESGLVRPAIVTEATSEYFEAQDTIGRWMEERCLRAPELVEKPGRLVADCRTWATESGEPVPTPQQFRSAMEKIPGIRFTKSRGERIVQGIGLRPADRDQRRGGADL